MAREPGQDLRPLARISMSIPEELLTAVDKLVVERSLPSRSHAIALILNEYIVNKDETYGEDVMCGTITLFYYNNVFDLQRQLAEMQYKYIDEVISSLHVQLIRNQTMEVILVQGPGRRIEEIAAEMIALRGIIYGKVQMVASVIPPLYLPEDKS